MIGPAGFMAAPKMGKRLSLEPDESMRWLYDYTHPDYNTDRAKHLREARARAIQSAPEWMKQGAALDDLRANASDDASKLPGGGK